MQGKVREHGSRACVSKWKYKARRWAKLDRQFKINEWDLPGGAVDRKPPASAEDKALIPSPERFHMPHSN